ncbi:DUF4748 domain-containing protein [Centropristis striata]|uniref:DUF4748 domain-containing protein n=1 Tax=Centropristis striata TaxID=184440 RepID=UPI0027DEFCB5|nr:DUF4748 domain-containing protein [Centropristis striata]
MAALYVTVRTALKGAPLGSVRWLLAQRSSSAPALAHCLRLQLSPAAALSSSRTEPQRSSTRRPGEEQQEQEEEEEGPEYIPRRRKAKNPMMKIGYAWMIGLPTGIIGFILTKRQVDKNRLKQLKIRQRMKTSNEGEYEGSRYRQHQDVKLDQ